MKTETEGETGKPRRGVPHWPGSIALLVIGAIYLLVSSQITLGPSWLPIVLVIGLVVGLAIMRRAGDPRRTHGLALAAVGVMTLLVVGSAAFLVLRLLDGGTRAPALLRDAALIWIVNVLTFALWYWEIDAGGPAERRRDHHTSTDFIFPQMTLPDATARQWSPNFLDYLFLSFNTSTAFSPTDTLVLSRRVKVLMMLQALLSLIVIAVLAARAVNTL